MEPRLINVNDLGRYTVVIAGHRYVPWTSLAEVPTAQQTFSELDRSRWEGCNECATPGCSTCKSIDIVPGYEPCSSCRRHTNYNPFKFCQYCGRPLTEEAWAELERRIGGNSGTVSPLD